MADGSLDETVDAARLDAELFGRCAAQPPELGLTLALARRPPGPHRGRGVWARDRRDTTLISWSMAKSITHAVFGLLVDDGRIALDDPAPVPEWAGDDRCADHGPPAARDVERPEVRRGLRRRLGVPRHRDAVRCRNRSDHAAYAAAFPLDHQPGTVWNYSSGTTNILARIAGDLVGGGRDGMERFLRERLFEPLGMALGQPAVRRRGHVRRVVLRVRHRTATSLASATLYLRDGVWEGRPAAPEGWAQPRPHGRLAAPVPDTERHGYGRTGGAGSADHDTFSANGYEAQRTIVVSPARDVVVVRLGKTPAERGTGRRRGAPRAVSIVPGRLNVGRLEVSLGVLEDLPVRAGRSVGLRSGNLCIG